MSSISPRPCQRLSKPAGTGTVESSSLGGPFALFEFISFIIPDSFRVVSIVLISHIRSPCKISSPTPVATTQLPLSIQRSAQGQEMQSCFSAQESLRFSANGEAYIAICNCQQGHPELCSCYWLERSYSYGEVLHGRILMQPYLRANRRG